jgi:FtsP/CotA-like multicopper oxidase with cupredoxin domain
MVRIGRMAREKFRLDRRELIAGLGAAALTPTWSVPSVAQSGPTLELKMRAESLALRSGAPETPVLSLGAPNMRFNRGETVEVAFDFDLSQGTLNWRGIDGAPAVEPLPARPSKLAAPMPLRHAGTFQCDLGLLPNARGWPTRAHPLVVRESEPVAVDRDEIVLIEDWRVLADGSGVTAGTDPMDAIPVFTVNGRLAPEFTCRANERLRLRFINACQRTVIAVKIDEVETRVMAIDSQPAEPFLARNGALVLAPGARVDAFVDVTAKPGTNLHILLHEGKGARTIGFVIVSRDPPARPAPMPPPPPLPSNGLPVRLELKNALRVDFALNGPDWNVPTSFSASAQPAFRAKTGRVVVLALTNRAAIATVFHLHGHHFRLLDRLDDGWKPFWLDTLAIEPGQTQRIAFAAENAGRWLIESVATDWAAPRLVRWYAVE